MGVAVGVLVGVAVAVGVSVGVGVAVSVGVAVGVGVAAGTRVTAAVKAPKLSLYPQSLTPRNNTPFPVSGVGPEPTYRGGPLPTRAMRLPSGAVGKGAAAWHSGEPAMPPLGPVAHPAGPQMVIVPDAVTVTESPGDRVI